jgi:hypothetical protein
MSEVSMSDRYAKAARGELGNALQNLEFVGGAPNRPLHAQTASAYAAAVIACDDLVDQAAIEFADLAVTS